MAKPKSELVRGDKDTIYTFVDFNQWYPQCCMAGADAPGAEVLATERTRISQPKHRVHSCVTKMPELYRVTTVVTATASVDYVGNPSTLRFDVIGLSRQWESDCVCWPEPFKSQPSPH